MPDPSATKFRMGKLSLSQQFMESLESLRLFRHRSLLALLGIMIGSGSVALTSKWRTWFEPTFYRF